MLYILIFFFFFKQKTAYELRISDWSSDVCSSDLILRAFDIGHDSETRMAEYMRLAGFTMLTERPDGQQFGFGIAPHPETGRSRVAGHIDGVITAGPMGLGRMLDGPGGARRANFPMLYPHPVGVGKGRVGERGG